MNISKIQETVKLLQNETLEEFCITGSAAIYYYLYAINTSESKQYMSKFTPNDIDFVIKCKRRESYQDISSIGSYVRTNKLQERVNYYVNSNTGEKIDILFEQSISYYTVSVDNIHINLRNPKTVKMDYEDNNRYEKNDFVKIEALTYICEELESNCPPYINKNDKKRYISFSQLNKNLFEDDDIPVKKNLFEDDIKKNLFENDIKKNLFEDD